MAESVASLWWDAASVRRRGREAVLGRQRARLNEAVAHARAHSPYYRELYQDLPAHIEDPALLPVTDKTRLMQRFDDWTTDRAVTLEHVQAFVADPSLAGTRLLNRYLVATTSGTTGSHGVFLIDQRATRVNIALTAPMAVSWLGATGIARLLARGGRVAMVVATGGHSFGATNTARLGRTSPRLAGHVRVLPAETPLPELVRQLNAFDPAVLVGYTSLVALLAAEQEAGRLRIRPLLVEPSGETLDEAARARIASAFDARVLAPYGATECPFLANACREGWCHVNADWVVAEPVDADYRPVPPGEESHTVLISNLANRVQPILRYDLGDSLLARPDPCPCGDPTPAVRVRGRTADVLSLPGLDGPVVLSPLVLAALADHVPGVDGFQLVQVSDSTLRVRLRTATGSDPDTVWLALRGELSGLLARNSARGVTIERADEPPQQSASGKYRIAVPS